MRNALALIPLLAGCLSEKVDIFTKEEFDLIETFSPLPPPPPSPTNKYADDPAAAVLGQMLFYEKGYSKALKIANTGLGNVGDSGKVACASCHDSKVFWSDTRSQPNQLSVAVGWSVRNTPSLVNVAYYEWGSWDGKDDDIWHQAAIGMESGSNFAGNRLDYAHLIYRKYRDAYNAIFPTPLDPALDPAHPDAARFPANGKPKSSGQPDGPWEMMAAADRDHITEIMANSGKAIAAYERLLVSSNAPIDQYVAGDHDALSPAAKRGLSLFIGKAACVDCHSGATFSDQKFHNTGVAQTAVANAPLVDEGRYAGLERILKSSFNGAGKYSDDKEFGAAKLALEVTEDMKGKFRTKSLRHIEMTGPYMHNGSLETLEDVVRWYNWGGGQSDFAGVKSAAMVPLNLTLSEEADLVAFLKALTGEPPPEHLGVDTSIP